MQNKDHKSGFWIIAFLFLTALGNLNAQQNDNPFDLTHRIKEQTNQKPEISLPENQNPFDLSYRVPKAGEVAESEEIPSENPFDIVRGKSLNPQLKSEPSKTNKVPKAEVSEDKSGNFVFWFILLMMVYLALLITIYKSLVFKIYKAFTNDNVLKLLHREQGTIISLPYFLLYLLFFLNAGVFIFFCLHYFRFIPYAQSYLYFAIFGITGLFLIKHVLLKIIEFVFPVQKEIRIYSFSIVIFSIILGLLLIPFNIISAFAVVGIAKIGTFGGLGVILAIYLFRFLRGLFIASKFISFHKFHFFMYLCTVEIAPVLILVKTLMNSAGIH